MKIKKFSDNHYIIKNKNDVYLSSYDSIVAKIQDNCIIGKEKIFFSCNWDHSTTTLKNLYNFLGDYSTIRIEPYNNTLFYELMKSKNKKNYYKI